MKQGRLSSFLSLLPVRLLALAACLTLNAAHADEYSDVAQLLREGKWSEAKVRVERHLAAKPRDPQMRLFRGVIQRETGRPAEAIATFTRLSEDHPELPEPYNNLAVIHAAQGQYDKARIALEKALRTNPSYATAHDNLADVYARLASQAYSKALQLDGAPQQAATPARLALIRELSPPPRQPGAPGAGRRTQRTGGQACRAGADARPAGHRGHRTGTVQARRRRAPRDAATPGRHRRWQP